MKRASRLCAHTSTLSYDPRQVQFRQMNWILLKTWENRVAPFSKTYCNLHTKWWWIFYTWFFNTYWYLSRYIFKSLFPLQIFFKLEQTSLSLPWTNPLAEQQCKNCPSRSKLSSFALPRSLHEWYSLPNSSTRAISNTRDLLVIDTVLGSISAMLSSTNKWSWA